MWNTMTDTSERSSLLDSDYSPSRLLPKLPDDISIQCIARIPRFFHPTLALVSRSWHSLLRSSFLFTVRSDLTLSHPFLCINIRTLSDQSKWYILDRHPRNPRPLLPLPPPPFPTFGSSCAAVGPTLFVLGGSLNGIPSHTVQVFDARFNRWSVGPRMGTARQFSAVGSVGGKIYAIGGCVPPSDSWAEVLDPDLRVWTQLPSPTDVREKWMQESAVLGGKLLGVGDRGGVAFDPAATEEQPSWSTVSTVLHLGWRGKAAVVDDVLYSFDHMGKIKGYDPTVDSWKQLDGWDQELPKFFYSAALANVGGVLCVIWEERQRGRNVVLAGIKVSRTSFGGLWGSIVWTESAVLALPRGSMVTHCVALEV